MGQNCKFRKEKKINKSEFLYLIKKKNLQINENI